jgi:hypothetical protein
MSLEMMLGPGYSNGSYPSGKDGLKSWCNLEGVSPDYILSDFIKQPKEDPIVRIAKLSNSLGEKFFKKGPKPIVNFFETLILIAYQKNPKLQDTLSNKFPWIKEKEGETPDEKKFLVKFIKFFHLIF